MTLVLYDNPASTNAHKIRLLLAELRLPAQTRPVVIGEPTAEYLALHPFGLVPLLVDDALAITESHVALRYLAEREGRADLRGETPAARARVDMLLDSLSLQVRPALAAVEAFAVYDAPADADTAAGAREALTAALGAYDRLLDGDGPYALGAFTIADCAIAGRMHHLERLGLDPALAPRVRRSLVAVRSRPAWATAIGAVAT